LPEAKEKMQSKLVQNSRILLKTAEFDWFGPVLIEFSANKHLGSWMCIRGYIVCGTTHTHTHTHTHTVHLDAGTESFVIEQHTHTLSAEMSVCVQTSESRHPNQDIRIKTFESRHPNQDIRIKTSESRHPNQDIRIKTPESRHQNQDIRIKTSESGHPNQDIKSSLLPVSPQMELMGTAKGLLANSLRSRHKGLHCLRPRRKCNQNWSKTAEFG
jgi:hypothetical protein